MRSPPPVLVIAGAGDGHARAVLRRLAAAGVPAERLDLARFPGALRLDLRTSARGRWAGRLEGGNGAAVDGGVRAVWWRRARPFALPLPPSGPRWAGVYCACQAAMSAFWPTLEHALWVNHPEADAAADHKPRQLALARRLGLATPESCITNDPAAARDFIARRPPGETIHKNVTSAPAIGRNVRVARADDAALLDSVRHLPLLLQERVRAAADLRVTVVGDDLFAAAIDFPDGRAPLDWRAGLRRARVRRARLPHDVRERLLRFTRALGLAYAAVDLRRRADGEHVFLEVNPAGQFLFVERRTGQPIADALAALLARGARGR